MEELTIWEGQHQRRTGGPPSRYIMFYLLSRCVFALTRRDFENQFKSAEPVSAVEPVSQPRRR